MKLQYCFFITLIIGTIGFGENHIPENDSIFFNLDSVYYRYEVIYSDTLLYDSLFKPISVDTPKQAKHGLRISGTKDFSFDVKQGFDQGLKVDITGEVEGVSVEGNISDKATPSSTIQLSEVEKMSLKVFTRNFYGGVGNLTLDLPFGIQDEIQGGRIGIHSENKEKLWMASYAVNRGAIKRMRFDGEEGKQSPYFLEGSVIPGSDRVYLAHGIDPSRLLERDEDYDIDYERGIISFTNKNIITNRSRIEVVYQQAIEDYANVYGESDGHFEIGDFRFTGIYRREHDEKENPLTFTMNASEIESLKLAGDSSAVLHTYADTSSQGDYIIQDSHFVYVGEGNGDYRVTFFYAGENKGEYIYDTNIKAFAYVGTGAGNYSPTKHTPLPEKDEFYGIGLDISEYLKLNLYGSNRDRNTFSEIDDHDNIGLGYLTHLSKEMSIFTIGGEYILYDEQFCMPQGKEEIDYQYQWNTDEALKEMGTVEVGIAPTAFLAAEVGYGILNRKHKRRSLKLKPLFFYFGYESVDSIDKYFAELTRKQGNFLLHSRYENIEKSHLINYNVKYFVLENANIGISGSYDKDTTNRGITTVLDIFTSPLILSLGHRLFNDTTFLFGNAAINVQYRGATLVGNLQQSQRYSQKRDETFVRVDEGEGNYVYDPTTGTYIEKDGGDYTKKTFLLQEFERVVSRNYSIEIGYAKSIFDTRGRFYYADEKDFFTNTNDLVFSMNNETYDVELNLRQDMTEDARYAVYKLWNRDRLVSIMPTYQRLSGFVEVREKIEKYNELVREKRNSYGGEIAYRIFTKPVVRPQIGYTYSKLFSTYFGDLDIRLHTPKMNLLFGVPFENKGRIEITGELIYRQYNIETIPYLFTATEPPGLTKIVWATASLGVADNTIFSLTYKIEFPPEQKLTQSLRFQTRIRF